MRGIKIHPQDFALKMQGGLMREGGRICGTLRYRILVKECPPPTFRLISYIVIGSKFTQMSTHLGASFAQLIKWICGVLEPSATYLRYETLCYTLLMGIKRQLWVDGRS